MAKVETWDIIREEADSGKAPAEESSASPHTIIATRCFYSNFSALFIDPLVGIIIVLLIGRNDKLYARRGCMNLTIER